MPIGGGGSGVSLGAARGSITIDLSDLQNVRVVTQQVGQEAEQNLGRINRGAQQARGGMSQLAGAAAGVAASFGIAFSIDMVRRIASTGTELARTAADLGFMRREFMGLIDAGGQSFDQILARMKEASVGYVSNADLLRNANRALMLGVVQDTAGLEQLLEIATARAGAMGVTVTQAFDDLVNGIGRTSPRILDNLGFSIQLNDAYDTFAQTVGKTTDELSKNEQQLALLQEVSRMAAGDIQRLKDEGESTAGAFQRLSTESANFWGEIGKLLEQPVSDWADRAAKAFEGFAAQIKAAREEGERLAEIDKRKWLGQEVDQGTYFGVPMDDEETTAGSLKIDTLRTKIGGLREDIASLREAEQASFDPKKVFAYRVEIDLLEQRVQELLLSLGRIPGGAPMPSMGPNMAPPGRRPLSGPMPTARPGMPAEAIEAGMARREGILEVEADTARQVQDAVEQYGSQRANTIASYEKQIARSSADYARGRIRAEEDFERSIFEIHRGRARRETQMAEDLAEGIADAQAGSAERVADWESEREDRIADVRENSAERLQEMEEEYQKNRERAQRDHQESLMGAAASLNATAVHMEQQRFARQQKEAEEDHKERVEAEHETEQERIDEINEAHEERLTDEAEALQESIDQQRKAYDDRLEQGRKSDQQRIDDMQESFDLQKKRAAEDHALQVARAAEDHQAQLAEMDRTHGERIRKIEEQGDEALADLEQEFQDQLDAIEGFLDDRLKLEKDHQEEVTEHLREEIKRRQTFLNKPSIAEPGLEREFEGPREREEVEGFQHGGPVDRTGLAMLHQGEFVMSREMLRRGEGSQRSMSVTFGEGAFQVFANDGQSPEQIVEMARGMFEQELDQFLEDMAT